MGRKQSLKKLAVMAVCGACMFQMAAIPAAADSLENAPYLWETFADENTDTVEDVATPRARGDVLNRGYIKLSNVDGRASVYGETLGIYKSDEIGLELYLEKYNGSSFYSYDDWSYVGHNVYYVDASFTVSVPKGYYYRLRGYHYVKNDGLHEAVGTMTNGLQIK